MSDIECSVTVFNSEDLKIDFNVKLNRLSIHHEKNNSWVSCTLSSFQMLIVLMRTGCSYENVVIDQISSSFEITKIGGNFCLKFQSKSHSSMVVLKYGLIPKLIHQSEIITAKITGARMRFRSQEANEIIHHLQVEKSSEIEKITSPTQDKTPVPTVQSITTPQNKRLVASTHSGLPKKKKPVSKTGVSNTFSLNSNDKTPPDSVGISFMDSHVFEDKFESQPM